MDDINFINNNGILVPFDDNVIKSSNRAFLYGDGIFESMHATGSEVQFLENHFTRLLLSAEKLFYQLPSSFNISYLEREIKRLFHRSRYFKGARVRLSVYRSDGGLYTPDSNKISWIIQGSKLHYENYRLNKKGLIVDLYEEIRKPVNIFSGIKTANSLLFVMAGLYRKRMNLDEVLIINDKGNIIESSSSNLFVYSDGKLFTAALNEGPLPGIMRDIVIRIAKEDRIDMVFSNITNELLLKADEVFLTNAVNGVQWVSAYKSKRYFNQFSYKIVNKLNLLSQSG